MTLRRALPWLSLALLVGLLPLACIARARVVRSTRPRLHLIRDMDNQGRLESQQAHPLFADRRAMRPPVEGTLAHGPALPELVEQGHVAGIFAEQIPVPLTAQLLRRGRERYAIYCAPCHGLAGYGDGMVSRRAERRGEARWVPPSSFHAPPADARPPGHLFNTIGRGIRTMPGYEAVIPPHDRWAIVGWVMTLQRSQRAGLPDVPPARRAELE
jgi:mono/diheme cytochrome c family protein